MNALRAFEAASRLGSVSKAAEELCVSQGAVSQQLRNLEDYLERELFVRTPNSFALSDDGEAFANVVQKSLADIFLAAGDMKREKSLRTLTLSMPPTLADKWLMPKLGDFYKTDPDVAVIIDKSVDLVTFKNDGIDAAIRYGDGQLAGLDSFLLIQMDFFAVASPAYIAKYGKLDSFSSPRNHRLIDHHYALKNVRSQHTHWQDLVEGNLDDHQVEHLKFPDGLQALNAAVQGQGIALAVNFMFEDEIRAGDIVLANPEPIRNANHYYFVAPIDARPNDKLDALRDWLLDVSRIFRDE